MGAEAEAEAAAEGVAEAPSCGGALLRSALKAVTPSTDTVGLCSILRLVLGLRDRGGNEAAEEIM